MSDTGESAYSINKRSDDQAWPNILAGLRAGGRLKLDHRINRAYLDGVASTHPCWRGLKSITLSRARRLEREGVIVQSGIDQYMLSSREEQ